MEALDALPEQIREEIDRLPDAPELIRDWFAERRSRRDAFRQTRERFEAGALALTDFLDAVEAESHAGVEDAMTILATTAGLGQAARQGLRVLAADMRRQTEEILAIRRRADILPMAPMGRERRQHLQRRDHKTTYAEPDEAFLERIGTVPTIRGGFDTWLDKMLQADALRLWRDFEDQWKTIGRRIRGSGKLHEWHMVTMLPDLRRLNIPSAEIRGIDFRTPTKELRVKDPATGWIFTHLEGTGGGEAREVFARFHFELADAIAAAAALDDASLMYRRFGEIAEDWPPNGVADLPPGIRLKLREL